MATALQDFIDRAPMCSTHEHTEYEADYVASKPDVLVHLFDNYACHDLIAAGAHPSAVLALVDPQGGDIGTRFEAVRGAWERVQFTGYGEAVRLTARALFGIESLSAASLSTANRASPLTGRPGERLHILRDVGNLTSVQIDPNARPLPEEAKGQDFFHYDISMYDFCNGTVDFERLPAEVGLPSVTSLADIDDAIERIISASAPFAVAIKSQHAYGRPLRWRKRSAEEAFEALGAVLRAGVDLPEEARLCLGDWCTSRVAALAAKYGLPFKIHTGYYAKNDFMRLGYIRAGDLDELVRQHLGTRFVLMHISYPYSDELIALAKHYSNVWIDMCWAWSINPLHAADFLRRALHSVPLGKVFVFGGDSNVPAASVGYALQARRWLGRLMQAEVNEGTFTEAEAIEVARYWMGENPTSFFDLQSKGERLKAASGNAPQQSAYASFASPPKAIRRSGKI